VVNEAEAMIHIARMGADYWKRLLQWGRAEGLITPTDAGVLEVAAAYPRRSPSAAQSRRIMECEEKLKSQGFAG
jgi:hypothetical protein